MWIELFLVSCTSLLANGFENDDMVGKGRWLVLNLLKCDKPEQYEVTVEITQKKINRTHDAFSFYVDLDRELNDTYGVEITANKEVDGGYQLHKLIIISHLFCKNVEKYIGNHWQEFLVKANIDPPECPVPVGELIVNDFVIDYREFHETDMYGKFDTYIYLTYMGRRITCNRLLIQFEKHHEKDDNDDDDY